MKEEKSLLNLVVLDVRANVWLFRLGRHSSSHLACEMRIESIFRKIRQMEETIEGRKILTKSSSFRCQG